MATISRREFIGMASAMGATLAWRHRTAGASRSGWIEARDRFPEGVASGDPRPDSVLLWTRCPIPDRRVPLTVEIAEDAAFTRVIATARADAIPENDWTVRVLVGGLAPRREYWYRFSDPGGAGSRIGRTLTAPSEDDAHAVRFAFVSCQNANLGAQNAYRRMLHEDERAASGDRLAFVLHLGDFIYEMVWYPEDRPKGYYDRTVRDIVRYAHGQKVLDFHIPTDLDDYRAIYRAYLHDPDLQDARARWPFVCMWDNHEFSWNGWQSLQNFGSGNVPAQLRKVAANQAWWEYQPARVATRAGAYSASVTAFGAPQVTDAPVASFDEHGLGQEANNLAAIGSLTAYRALRFGRHLDLIVTDQRSYRSETPAGRPEADAFASGDFPSLVPEEVLAILDAGRAWNEGHPPATIRYGDRDVPNFRRDEPPQTILGAAQKQWFLERLKASRATWKVWGNSQGTLDYRADPQNLPTGTGKPWPGAGYAGWRTGDPSGAYVERAEIYDFVTRERIAGFACVAGDRHSFWAGRMAKSLPPAAFEPVGVAFITGSISAPGSAEANEYRFPKSHPLRALFLTDRPGAPRPEPALNMLLRHGVRSCLEYAASGDVAKARALSNPANAPHLDFVDTAGHGYATVRASDEAIECEFVCIPRPVTRSTTPDGGPLRYRVTHRAARWRSGERPVLEQRVLEGDPGLAI